MTQNERLSPSGRALALPVLCLGILLGSSHLHAQLDLAQAGIAKGRTQTVDEVLLGQKDASGSKTIADALFPISASLPEKGFAPERWSAGPDWKASFHDGFRFFPVLGKAHAKNLPLSWKTVSIRRDKTEIHDPAAQPVQENSETIQDYRFAKFTERYVVSTKGVEQRFVFDERPSGTGDLLVEGIVTTALVAEPRDFAVGPLVFRDENGTQILEYGAAKAVDASGAEVPVEARYADHRLVLRIPDAWLEKAVFPVVLDPVIQNITIVQMGSTSYTILHKDIATNQNTATPTLCYTYARYSSGSDLDILAFTRGHDMTGSAKALFSDLSTSWSSHDVNVSFLYKADKWIFSFVRRFTSSSAGIRCYLHKQGDAANKGSIMGLESSSHGSQALRVKMGAERSTGDRALLVWQQRQTSPSTTEWQVYGAFVTGSTGSRTAPKALCKPLLPTPVEREYPNVVDRPFVNDQFPVVWQERGLTSSSKWYVKLNRIGSNGSPTTYDRTITPGASGQNYKDAQIAGQKGRYLVTYTIGTPSVSSMGKSIETLRVDWPDGNTSPTYGERRVMGYTTTSWMFNGDLVFDYRTGYHWTLSYLVATGDLTSHYQRVARVGHSGGVVEKQTLLTSPAAPLEAPGLSFASYQNESQVYILLTDLMSGSNPRLSYNRMTLNPLAKNTDIGSKCMPNVFYSAGTPNAGEGDMFHMLFNAKPSSPALFVIGTSTWNVPLSGIGSPCSLYVVPTMILSTVTSSTQGKAVITVALPDAPAFYGTYFTQWAWLDFSIKNKPMLYTTQAIRHDVR